MARTAWQIDPSRSDLLFTVRHLVISKVRGRFRTWTATLLYDPEEPTGAKVEVTIDAASIDTGDAARDAALRSADFLNPAKYPTLAFASTRVEAAGRDRFRLHGDLTVRDVTRPVVLQVQRLAKARFRATVTIQRADFGATWNQALEAGGLLVGKHVDVEIALEATAAAGSIFG
jgi:polyisoprenoid-binding protein YceI